MSVIRQYFSDQIPSWICRLPEIPNNWNALQQTLEGHSGTVSAVAISLDGKLVASGGGGDDGDGTVKLWDAATGALQQTLEGHSERGLRGGDLLGRQAGGVRRWRRQRRWHSQALGCGHGDAAADARGPLRPGLRGGDLLGRQAGGVRRRRRWHGQALGCGHGGAAADARGPLRPGLRGGVLLGRQAGGVRRATMARSSSGMRPRGRCSRRSRATPTRSTRWRPPRTASWWRPAATTATIAQSSSGMRPRGSCSRRSKLVG